MPNIITIPMYATTTTNTKGLSMSIVLAAVITGHQLLTPDDLSFLHVPHCKYKLIARPGTRREGDNATILEHQSSDLAEKSVRAMLCMLHLDKKEKKLAKLKCIPIT